jgi:peroxiredoxin Q/BCP
MSLKLGNLAPVFSLPDQDGTTHKLADYRGQWVLVYFYPKDDTPGCTTEACGFRDNLPRFTDSNVVVLGISTDSVKSHKKFAEKHGLPFTLLSDEDKKVVEAYKVWGEKKFMGRTYMGTNRMSFLVNPEGKLVKIYEKVKPADHPTEVLADVATLTANHD